MRNRIDVVVPVYNSLDQVKACIQSLLDHIVPGVRIIIVNDASGAHVLHWLESVSVGNENIVLLNNAENQGYLRSVNSGLELSDGEFVVLQNSDTVVFEGFYGSVVEAFESDEKIGIVSAISNWANWTRIPFPEGWSAQDLSSYIRQSFRGSITDINSASGFCFAMRRELVDQVGMFDLDYDPGYWEETDYCMKALSNGWRVVVDQGLFVYHHGWSSFGKELRNTHMQFNEKIFKSRWSEEYSEIECKNVVEDPLRAQRLELESLGSSFFAKAESGASRPSVLYILPSLSLYGGVISVLQVINQLVTYGINASAVVIGDRREESLRYSPCYFKPMLFDTEEEFLDACKPVDIVVATAWSTTFLAKKMSVKSLAEHLVYFVQDYEPDFYRDDSIDRRLARLSYSLVENRICKTKWLFNKLQQFDGENSVIPLGLNTDVFADHGYARPSNYLISMARPSSERRNWKMTLEVFEEINSIRPDIEIAVFGFGFKGDQLPSFIKSFGLLSSANDVSRLLNQSKVLLDASHYQGFGRPGLEAMSCGVVPVLTMNGGITSYAKDRKNCLLIDPQDRGQIVNSILELYADDEFYDQLQVAGRRTAQEYTLDSEGRKTLKYFHEIMSSALSFDDLSTHFSAAL